MKIEKLPILALLLLLILPSGCSRQAKKARHLQQAQGYFKAEQYDKAEIEFRNVLRLERTNAAAILGLGVCYFNEGRIPQAYPLLQRSFETDTNNTDIRLRLASIHLVGGKLKEARDHALAVLAREPGNDEALLTLADTAVGSNDVQIVRERLEALRPQAGNRPGFHLALGSLAFRQQKTNEAAAAFQQALSLDPNSSAAHVAMGNLELFRRDLAKAEQHFKSASELAPLHTSRRLQYADFKLKTGDLQAARQSLEQIIKQAPDFIPPYTRLAEIAFAEKKFDEALALAKKALLRDPMNYEAMLVMGRLDLNRGEAAKAVADFERIVAVYPKLPQAHYQLAVAHLLNKNQAKAMTSLQQSISLDPKYADAQVLLAELNIRKGNYAAATVALRQLIKEQPQITQAYLLLATAYRAQKQFDDAATVYRFLMQASPSNPQPHFLLAQVLLQQRKNAEARKELEKALQITPNYLAAFDDLTDLDIAEKQFAAAHERVQANLDKYTNSPSLLFQQAKIFSAQSNYVAAEASLKKAIEFDSGFRPGYLALARVYTLSKRHQQALESLQAAVAKNTNDVTALFQIGAIHSELKNYALARDAYEKILTVNPRFTPALNNLAYIYSEHLNQLDKAYAMARSARELQPADPFAADTLGWILFKRGEYPWALSLLQECSTSPFLQREPEVFYHLGMTHYMLGEEQPAILAFQRALELNKDFPGKDEAQRRLDRLSMKAPSADPATLRELEKELAAQPGDPILLARMALAYEQTGAFDKAAAIYEQTLKRNPKNTSAALKLAQLYSERLNQPAKAMALLKDARAVAPEDPALAHTLGRLAFRAGDHRWSASLLQDSARKLPGDANVLYDLAWSEYSIGRVPEAQSAMQAALKGQLEEPKLALAKSFLGAIGAAEQIGGSPTTPVSDTYEEVRQKNPNFLPAIFLAGRIQEQQGSTAAAKSTYEEILRRFPHFTPAHKRLAILLAPSDPARAYEYATRAREAFPEDPEVARTLGILVYNRKEYSRAVQLLKESSRKRPEDGELFYYLGMAHFQLKQNKESRQALQQALALKTNAQFAAEATRILTKLN
jgi:tetratricopeptide (TPR) repeat protein